MLVPRSTAIRAAALAIPVIVFLAAVALEIASGRKADYDERIFLDVAERLRATGLPIRTFDAPGPAMFFDHTPLLVYALAGLTAIGGDTLTLARSVSVGFGLATIVVAYLVALRVHGPAAGFMAAFLIAANPLFVELSWFVRMEVPLCFFLVAALWALDRDRSLLAGVAIATAVMLKEIALAFWIVAACFVLIRRGRRAALLVAAPAPIALSVWFAYAAYLDADQLRRTVLRWGASAGGSVDDPRVRVTVTRWARVIVADILWYPMLIASGAAAPLAAMWRRRIPALAWVPIAYVLLAVASSLAISLKEPRYLIAVVPMTAIAIALVVDWDRVVREIGSPSDTGVLVSSGDGD